MLELWHIAVKLLEEDEPEIVSITSNTLSGAMSVAAQSLAFKLGVRDEKGHVIPASLRVKAISLVGIGRP
jgi:hypothetical protein